MFPKIKTEKKAERQKKKKQQKNKKKKLQQFAKERCLAVLDSSSMRKKIGEHATGIETFRDKGQLKI